LCIAVSIMINSAIFFWLASGNAATGSDFRLIAIQPIEQLRREGAISLDYPYPLWTPLLLAPFVLASREHATQLWLCFNIVLLSCSIVLMVHLLNWKQKLRATSLFTVALLLYQPIFVSLWLGQLVFLSLWTLILTIRAIQTRQWAAAGVTLGLGLIKPQVTLLISAGVFGDALWRRTGKLFAGFGVTALSFVALSAPFAVEVRQIAGGGIGGHLKLYLAHTSTLWGLLLTTTGSIAAAVLACAALLLWNARLWQHSSRSKTLEQDIPYLASVTLIVNLLTLPYSWSYNHALLAIPILVSIREAWTLSQRKRLIFAIAMVLSLYVLPPYIHASLTLPYESDVYQVLHVLVFLMIVLLVHSAVLRNTRRQANHQNSGQP
jgi:hypothetical protein